VEVHINQIHIAEAGAITRIMESEIIYRAPAFIIDHNTQYNLVSTRKTPIYIITHNYEPIYQITEHVQVWEHEL